VAINSLFGSKQLPIKTEKYPTNTKNDLVGISATQKIQKLSAMICTEFSFFRIKIHAASALLQPDLSYAGLITFAQVYGL